MRLIDADALGVGRCSRELLPAEYCAGWNGLVSLIEQAPTIDAVEVVRWIPVEEQLPEPFVSVLVHMPIEYPMPTVREGFLSQAGEWYGGLYRRDTGIVTHWMPLPEPPKEVE